MADSTERERIGQSNAVADIVFDQIKKAWPDLHPVLDLRYGIADALWDAGYRLAAKTWDEGYERGVSDEGVDERQPSLAGEPNTVNPYLAAEGSE